MWQATARTPVRESRVGGGRASVDASFVLRYFLLRAFFAGLRVKSVTTRLKCVLCAHVKSIHIHLLRIPPTATATAATHSFRWSCDIVPAFSTSLVLHRKRYALVCKQNKESIPRLDGRGKEQGHENALRDNNREDRLLTGSKRQPSTAIARRTALGTGAPGDTTLSNRSCLFQPSSG